MVVTQAVPDQPVIGGLQHSPGVQNVAPGSQAEAAGDSSPCPIATFHIPAGLRATADRSTSVILRHAYGYGPSMTDGNP